MSGTIVALEMLGKNKTVAQRAESYVGSIKRNIQRDVIDSLIARKEKLEEEKFELSDFTLDTNINSGHRRMTAEDCEKRFKRLIDVDYELALLDIEIKVKQASYDKYFNTTTNS